MNLINQDIRGDDIWHDDCSQRELRQLRALSMTIYFVMNFIRDIKALKRTIGQNLILMRKTDVHNEKSRNIPMIDTRVYCEFLSMTYFHSCTNYFHEATTSMRNLQFIEIYEFISEVEFEFEQIHVPRWNDRSSVNLRMSIIWLRMSNIWL